MTDRDHPLRDIEAETPLASRVNGASAAQQRRLVVVAILRALLTVTALLGAYALIPFDRATTAQIGLIVAAAVVLIMVMNVFELRAVALAEFPTLRAMQALTLSLVVLLVAFAGIYMVLSNNDTMAFDETLDHTGALYFSLTTLSTIGYGDIVPVSHGARVAVMTQMVVDVLVIAVFLRLITKTVKSRLSLPPDG
jgi:hypothetical protein